MSRREDLEISIRESYGLIRDYERIERTTSDPKEKRRAQLGVAEQWQLIKTYLTEYLRMRDSLQAEPSPDIVEIAAAVGLASSFSHEAPVCPSCGVAAQPAARFCPRCGARLQLATATGDVEIEVQGDRSEDVAHVLNEAIRQFRPSPPRIEHKGGFYALLVGIARYRIVRALSKTVTDARDLHGILLQTGYPQDNIALLLDEAGTKHAIDAKLEWLARRTGPDDTVVIFFSGHGVQFVGGFSPGEYLCPVEADLNKVKDTLISTDEFSVGLRSIRAGRIVVFLDACHAGGVGETKDPNLLAKSGLSDSAYDQLYQGHGRVIIASSRSDEVSYELASMRNGLFTHYLLEGLRGAAAGPDGAVWVTNLFGYVSKKVSQDKPQHPFLKSATEDFVVARRNISEPRADSDS